MIKRKIYLLLSLTILTLCCVSCIQLCIETSRSQKYAAKHSEFKALNADDLKRLLIDDTSCYKFVVFFPSWCYCDCYRFGCIVANEFVAH